MKKRLFMLTFAAVTGATGACAQEGAKKILTVYFSHGGNTKAVAEMINATAGGDILRIETRKPYPTDYREVVDRAKKEVEAGYRPEIEDLPIDIDDYDVIFVGSPCWWYTMALAVATFLSSHDFKGKAIAPFMTHEGSHFARTLDDIRKMCPDAVLLEGFTVRGSKAREAMPDVREWIERLGLKR